MVYYLSASGDGIDRYAETKWDILDVPINDVTGRLRYAHPDEVHPSALKEHVQPREQGYWLDPETLPKQVLWGTGSKPPLPDVLPWFTVSPRFKDLVEQFEPGVHQFVPVDIYQSKKGEAVATYYWFIVGQRLDSVDRERTTFKWRAPKEDPSDGRWISEIMDTTTFEFTPIPNARLVFSNDQVAGHHIWHDPHVLTFGNRLCSDAFAEALLASGMTGVAATPRKSV
jgi:hypothetical protein